MSQTFAPKSFTDALDSQDFNDQADSVIESVLPAVHAARTQVQQAVTGAVQQAQALPSIQIPSLDALTAGWVDRAPKPPAADATPDQPTAQTGLSSFAMPSLASLTSGWLPKPSTGQPPGQGGAAVAQPQAMPTSSVPSSSTGLASGPIDNTTPESFIRSAYPHALQAAGGNRDLADYMVATAISENGDVGTGKDLSGTGYNFAGIHGQGPAGSWQGLDAGRPTTFASFNTPEEGIGGFLWFLRQNPRYAGALATYQQTGDTAQLFRDVQAQGYAEDPAWAGNVNSIAQNRVKPITAGLTDTAPASRAGQTASPPGGASSQDTRGDVDQQALDDPDKWALCGPVAAVIAAQTRGQNWTVAQARQIAQAGNLWDANLGMHGLESEVTLLNRMNISARTGAASQEQLAADAQAGNTPIISTNKHFFILKGYDPTTGRFDTTTTGPVLRGGSRWLTLDQIGQLGNGIQGAAYFDNPTSPTPSVVAGASASGASPAAPGSQTGNAAGSPSDQPMSYRLPLGAATPGDAAPTDAPSTSSGVSDASAAAPAPGGETTGAGAFQDDQTQGGWVQPAMPPGPPVPDMRGTANPRPLAAPGPAPFNPLAGQGPASPDEVPQRPEPAAPSLTPVWDAANTLIGSAQAAGSAIADSQPARDYTDAIAQANAEADARDAKVRGFGTPTVQTPAVAALDHAITHGLFPGVSSLGDFMQAAGLTLADLSRGADIARAVLTATPTATTDVLDSALATAGLDRSTLGLDVPVVGRVGLADALMQVAGMLPGGVGEAMNVLGSVGPLPIGRAGAGPAAGRVAGALENIGDRGAAAVRGAVRSGLDAAGTAVANVGEHLGANAAETAALDAERAGQGSVTAAGTLGAVPAAPEHVYSPSAPEGYARMYHGTASDFPAVDPERLDPNGLYGPGYYTTSDPRVAGSYAEQRNPNPLSTMPTEKLQQTLDMRRKQLAEADPNDAFYQRIYGNDIQALEEALAGRGIDGGPNVRAVDVPSSLNLADADAPLTTDVLDRVSNVVDQMRRANPQAAAEFDDAVNGAAGMLQRGQPATVDNLLTGLLGASERVSSQLNGKPDRGIFTEVMQRAGFDGVRHTGGQRVPLLDGAGQPIEHNVNVIFPNAVGKVRNAFSGTYGGATVGPVTPGGSGMLDAVNRQVGSALVGGVTGAAVGAGTDQEDPARGARRGAVIGAGLAVAGHNAMRLAGNREGGALASLGAVPPERRAAFEAEQARLRAEGARATEQPSAAAARLFPDDPLQRGPGLPGEAPRGPEAGIAQPEMSPTRTQGQLGMPGLPADPLRDPAGPGTTSYDPARALPPAVQSAVQQAQAQQARTGLPPLTWTRHFLGEVGYSSMIGPATFSVNVLGNLMEPVWSIPKEGARAVVRGNPREFAEMAGGAFHGMGQLGTAMVDALAARGRYAPVPGHEPLSTLTNNPIGKAITTGLEAGGRIFSALPDAVFGTIAQGAGEARAAAQIATDAGLKGQAWKQHVSALLADVEQVKAGQLPSMAGTHDVIAGGEQYAKRQTFQDELGDFGKRARSFARVGDMPVVGNLVTPFFNTPWNMNLRMLERTPAGFTMNSQGSRFDKLYDATLGSALLIGLAAGPVAAGTITGGGPDDPQKKSEMRSQGWRPYSTLVDGVYVPNRVFGVYAPLMNAAADVHDAIAYAKDASPSSVASDYAGRLGAQIQQQPYLQGISSIMQAIQAGQGGGLSSAAENYAASTLTRMVPYAATARTVGTALDPNERTVDRGKNVPASQTVSQQVQGGIGLRGDLPVSQDVLGRPQANPQQGFGALFAKTSSSHPDPVVGAFLGAGVDITGPRQGITFAGSQIPLTPAEQRRWNEVRGDMLTRLVGPLAQSGALDRMPQATRERMLKTFLANAATQADTRVFGEMNAQDRSQRLRDAMNAKLKAS